MGVKSFRARRAPATLKRSDDQTCDITLREDIKDEYRMLLMYIL